MDNSNTSNPLKKLSKYENELGLAKNSGNLLDISNWLLNLGKLCHEIEADELGLKYVQEAIKLSKKHSEIPHLYEFYSLLGDFNFRQGLINEAYDAYKRSNKKLPKKELLKLRAENSFKLGKVSEILNYIDLATKHYKDAKEIFGRLKLFAETAKCLNRIGVVYIKKIPWDLRGTIDPIFDGSETAKTLQASNAFFKARRSFKNAITVLEQNNLQEIESELYNTIQTNLKDDFYNYTSKKKPFQRK